MIYLINCQKNSQWKIVSFLMVLSIVLSPGCGKIVNKVPDQAKINKSISLLIAESNCLSNSGENSPIFKEVIEFRENILNKSYRLANDYFKLHTYDYLNPLIVNPQILREMMNEISLQEANRILSISELDRLLEYAYRYEATRCSLSNLMSKESIDLRPYFFATEGKDYSSENLYQICSKLEKKGFCLKEIEIASKNNNLEKIRERYLKKFEEEVISPLFTLRNNHNKFKCNKVDDLVIINIDVFNSGWSKDIFKLITASIAQTWSIDGVRFNLIEVPVADSKSIQIKVSKGGVSHVNDSEPRIIHLQGNLDFFNIGKVASHEFGHVLGFRDCYIEFFDSNLKHLVYYELPKEQQNIMCSLKFSSKVSGDYIEQIKQKSCNF